MMPRWVLRVITVLAVLIIGRWALNSAFVLSGNRIMYPEWVRDSRDYIEIAAALAILGVIVFYEGKDKAGLGNSLAFNVRTSLQGIYSILTLGLMAYQILWSVTRHLILSGSLPVNPITVGVSNEPSSAAEHILWSFHAGIVEEIILIAFMFYLFKRSRLKIGDTPFWMTGWATAIVIAVRMSYHTYHGIMVIGMILTGWLMVRLYRTTGSVIPCIVVHITWDLSLFVSEHWAARMVIVLCLILLTETITRGSDAFGLFGFPHFPFENKQWLGFYWARWRWEKGLEKPSRYGTGAVNGEPPSEHRKHVGLNSPDA